MSNFLKKCNRVLNRIVSATKQIALLTSLFNENSLVNFLILETTLPHVHVMHSSQDIVFISSNWDFNISDHEHEGSSILAWFLNARILLKKYFNLFALQGNSNSISTVDVSAGYIGLEDYQPVVIGILMALSTYSGPIFWTISLIKTLIEIRCLHARDKKASLEEVTNPIKSSQHPDKKSSKIMNVHRSNKEDEGQKRELSSGILEICFVLVLTRALPLAVYTVLVSGQRYHLFVWTVFSPKLLYEGMHTLVVSILVLVLLAIKLLFCR